MMRVNKRVFPDCFDDVDKEIYQYLVAKSPSSFLLFAGAGSGKTRTLVKVLEHIKKNDLQRYIETEGKIAVITYTNAACIEIKQRLKFDSAFRVSTIHSFAWDLIKPFSEDIREYLRNRLTEQIQELQSKIDKARDKNGKTALKNTRSRDGKQKRLDKIDSVLVFSYSPSVGKPERDALNHAEVISMASEFIANRPLMQTLLINRFPVLLVDESQDTDKSFITALISTQQSNKEKFVIGLFGDMMQRIYGGGKDDLDTDLPDDWKRPAKVINYRCPVRVVNLINDVRFEVDGIRQTPKKGAVEGTVRLFIVRSDIADKATVEQSIRNKMMEITQDEKWTEFDAVKCLTLEHAMAADRGGFTTFFIPLSKSEGLRDSVLNGTSREIKFITDQVLPLINAIKSNDLFEITRIVKKGSSVISNTNVGFIDKPLECIEIADESAERLKVLLLQSDMCLIDLLRFLSDSGLLILPERLQIHIDTPLFDGGGEEEELLDDETLAWGSALQAKISHVQNYSDYIFEKSGFATHQGVKGLEFERVMAVLDDESAGGFLFKYEKLLGAEPLSATDLKNRNEGKDSTPLRTRRLFYVICSRAEKSLAIVAYTKSPKAIKMYAVQSLFSEDEIVMV